MARHDDTDEFYPADSDDDALSEESGFGDEGDDDAFDDDDAFNDDARDDAAPRGQDAAPIDVRSEADRAAAYGRFPLDALVGAIRAGQRGVVAGGLHGAVAAIVLTELQRRVGRAVVVVARHTDDVRVLAEDLALFSPLGDAVSLVVPSVDVSPYSGLSPNRIRVAERLAACFRLLHGEAPPFVLMPISGLVRRCPPASIIEHLSDVVAPGSEIDLPSFRRRLIDSGYSPVQVVEDPGTFAVRGGIIDIFSPTRTQPVRIELWGDEVESLRAFDPQTQKGLDPVDGLYICPVREEVFTEETLRTARERLRAMADEMHFPSRALKKVLADLGHGLHFLGIEALLPAFYPALDALVDFVPSDAVVVVLDPEGCRAEARATWEAAEAQYERRREAQELVFAPADLFVAPAQIDAWLSTRADVQANLLARPDAGPAESAPELDFPAIVNADVARMRRERGAGEGAVHALIGVLAGWRQVYGELAFACRTSGTAERLVAMLRAHGQKTELAGACLDLTAARQPPCDTLRVYRAPLSAGARLPARGLAIVTDEELFGPRARRKVKPQRDVAAHFIESFRELKPGDFLVHVEHGIGRYEGLIKLEVGGHPADFLQIAYAGDDRLYIPVYRLDSVQKYSGGEEPKRIDKLGGTAWERTKERVKESLKAMAIDLLKLYAERQSRSGYAFSTPSEYFQEFEASFAFEETPDQNAAIEKVLEDMQARRPMDRLICGDVGFGKTEVAMRATMLAILDGKQAAVLVPTTILAEQHLNTFRTRFSDYPVRVEALSRFRSAKETRAILADLAVGRVDVVIGTHRLLSSDVVFRDLGLLVVDEEHRFGVTHKEKIKELASRIDAITMTATPIPRTLQMSLFGLRDLSVIATPPQDRLAVRTYVAREEDEVVREAILRELQRGGQVYYLHNRVQTIEQRAEKLRELLPEARIGIGHGQMDERRLERVMLDFVRGEINVLVCTTIIESGLDIPNANCLIVSRADMFGLAQLYQLRGRVGRSSARAHCYLLLPDDNKITGEARDRLEAIQRFTELGSGLEIAQFDLELRGAGNLLGADQSGHIATVGLDLYSELLEEAMAELRGEEVTHSVEPEVNLPIEAHLPDDYIPDVQLRLLFYKRLSAARDAREIFDVYGELADRFGAPPKPVEALREVMEVKGMVKALGARGVDANRAAVIVNIGEQSLLDPPRIVAMLAQARPGRYALRPDLRLVMYLSAAESEDVVATTKAFLTTLRGCLRTARHG